MRQTLDFLLHDGLRVTTPLDRPRFAEHSADTCTQALDTCERIERIERIEGIERIACGKFAPFKRLADTQEPHFDGERVHRPQATHEALAHATPDLQAFGPALQPGKQAALRYFHAYELPTMDAWPAPVARPEDRCRTVPGGVL